jgi:hypothetical protein
MARFEKSSGGGDEDMDAMMRRCMQGGKSMRDCLDQMGRGKGKGKKTKGGKVPPQFTKKGA